MKRKMWIAVCFVTVLLLLITSCAQPPEAPENQELQSAELPYDKGLKPAEQFGTIPAAFETIIRNNAFYGVTAFSDRLLRSEDISVNIEMRTVERRIVMMDLYGNELAAYTVLTDDAYRATILTATEDGGFLFVLGFVDYQYGPDSWASDKGFASRIVKCGKNGELQFDKPLSGIESSALAFCFERPDGYYFFGTHRDPAKWHEHGETDVYEIVLDRNGEQIKSGVIRGSDFDSLKQAEETDNGFRLSISSQSSDGDFEGSTSGGQPGSWYFEVDTDLRITGKTVTEDRFFWRNRLGEKNGKPVYSDDDLFKNFDDGTPKAYIDYGEFYLIVSSNATSVYKNTPLYISSIWYNWETVYSAYDSNGNLLFRDSVDFNMPVYGAWRY